MAGPLCDTGSLRSLQRRLRSDAARRRSGRFPLARAERLRDDHFVIDDFERCYRAVCSRDPRFDGWFFVAVTTTGIYCRPSCPATTPKASNVRFYATAAAAQANGFRACRRCRPDVTPGSPEWATRGDVVARAMRLVADGVVDREGVPGMARRLGYSVRHLNRLLTEELGAGPLALARAERARTARVLIETTDLPSSHIAFAAGFSSIRQYNDTVREVFASSPSELRARRRRHEPTTNGTVTVRLPVRAPFDGRHLLDFLAVRAIPGVEDVTGGTYRRSLTLAHGTGIAALTPVADPTPHVRGVFHLSDLRDLATAVSRCRRLFDLDADPHAIDELLRADPMLGQLVRKHPGRRVPGTVDGAELAVRAVLGQQVTVAGARTLASRLVQRRGRPLEHPEGTITHCFPTPAELSSPLAAGDGGERGNRGDRGDRDDGGVFSGMPASRRRALETLTGALADGSLDLHPGVERAEVSARLNAMVGIGPWTADYIALRCLRDPDVFLSTDLAVLGALRTMGLADTPREAAAVSSHWRPWRSYALIHVWSST
jgi:AraC family transcriptional regulator, regulatory protein of adaptative response / DNA-3-methyladenine glycosylase II